MKKEFDIKYDFDDKYCFYFNNNLITGRIEQYRIIGERDKTKIQYLMIVPYYELIGGVHSNNVWIDENDLYLINKH